MENGYDASSWFMARLQASLSVLCHPPQKPPCQPGKQDDNLNGALSRVGYNNATRCFYAALLCPGHRVLDVLGVVIQGGEIKYPRGV